MDTILSTVDTTGIEDREQLLQILQDAEYDPETGESKVKPYERDGKILLYGVDVDCSNDRDPNWMHEISGILEEDEHVTLIVARSPEYSRCPATMYYISSLGVGRLNFDDYANAFVECIQGWLEGMAEE